MKQMLENIQAYFNEKVFTLDEVDVVVLAASAALNINLYILSHNRVADTITLIKAPVQNSTQSIILKYNWSGGSYHGFDHYQPLVKVRPAVDLVNATASEASVQMPPPSASVNSASTNSQPTVPTISQAGNLPSEPISISSSTTTPSIDSQQVAGNQLCTACGTGSFSSPLKNVVAGDSSLPLHSTQTPSSGSGATSLPQPLTQTPSSGCGTTSQPQPLTSSFSQKVPQFKTAHSLFDDAGLTNSQRQMKDTAVHEEVILRDTVDACTDDREGNYFDEYRGGVSVQPGIDLTNAIVQEATSEEIMSLAEFFGEDDDNTPFVPSQETSDDEGAAPPVIYGVADDSDQEITEIPVKFRPSPRKRKGRYMKTLPDYPKLARLPIEEVKSLPWDVDGDRHFKVKNCTEDTWVDWQKDGR